MSKEQEESGSQEAEHQGGEVHVVLDKAVQVEVVADPLSPVLLHRPQRVHDDVAVLRRAVVAAVVPLLVEEVHHLELLQPRAILGAERLRIDLQQHCVLLVQGRLQLYQARDAPLASDAAALQLHSSVLENAGEDAGVRAVGKGRPDGDFLALSDSKLRGVRKLLEVQQQARSGFGIGKLRLLGAREALERAKIRVNGVLVALRGDHVRRLGDQVLEVAGHR